MSRLKTGGKISAGVKKFPRISDFLESKYPKVYQALVDTGMIGNLTPKRGTGRTFLIPDSKLLTEINKLLKSADDGPEKASEIIGSLIIKDYLPTSKEWAAKKDDIPNIMGKKVQVKSITNNKVELIAGTITPEDKYVPFSRQGRAPRGNTAVWKLSGHVPHDDKVPDATGKYIRRGAPVKGAFELRPGMTLMEFAGEIGKDLERGEEHPFADALCGLLVISNDKLTSEFICMNLAHGIEAAFFLSFQLTEPDNRRVLKDSVNKFLNSNYKKTTPNPYNTLLQEWAKKSVEAAKLEERYDVLDAASSGNIIKKLEEAYKKLAEENKIGDQEDILPEVLFDRLKEMERDDNLDIAAFLASNDELGFKINALFESSRDKIKALDASLDLCRSRKPTFAKYDTMKGLIKPAQWYLSGPGVFVRSSHCLNFPMNPETIKGMGDYDEEAKSPFSGEDINVSAKVVGSMEEYANNCSGGGDLSIPDDLLACLRGYVSATGISLDTKLSDLIKV